MIESIEKRLSELIPLKDETLYEAARYSLLSKGKRIRPRLVLAAAATFGVDPMTLLDVACALEMVHTYSLIHDDLPCVDNDDLRRGKPTLHKIYGEAIALLVGDYLLTYAFEVIVNAASLGREQRLQMVKTVAQRGGAAGMIGGQTLDVESQGAEIDEETLLQMHYGKTGALFTACLECGSLGAGYPSTPLLQSIGMELGLAYQFHNDLLDATSTTALLGKQSGADAANKKPTAVSLFGVLGTEKKVEAIHSSMQNKIKQLPKNGEPLKTLIEQILQRKYGRE